MMMQLKWLTFEVTNAAQFEKKLESFCRHLIGKLSNFTLSKKSWQILLPDQKEVKFLELWQKIRQTAYQELEKIKKNWQDYYLP